MSRYAEIFSVGQLHAETMGRPGLFGLCILGIM